MPCNRYHSEGNSKLLTPFYSNCQELSTSTSKQADLLTTGLDMDVTFMVTHLLSLLTIKIMSLRTLWRSIALHASTDAPNTLQVSHGHDHLWAIFQQNNFVSKSIKRTFDSQHVILLMRVHGGDKHNFWSSLWLHLFQLQGKYVAF